MLRLPQFWLRMDGEPVTVFCRIDEQSIRTSEAVTTPTL